MASICRKAADPQDLTFQVKLLREAGVLVDGSNARETAACSWLLGKGVLGIQTKME